MQPGGAANPLTVAMDVHRPALGGDRFPASAKVLYFQPAEAGSEGVDNVALYLQH